MRSGGFVVTELNSEKIQVVGVDVFLVKSDGLPLPKNLPSPWIHTLISNRGTKIWPGELPNIELVNVHRCRFTKNGKFDPVQNQQIHDLLSALVSQGFEWVHVEKLLRVDGKNSFSLAQGE